MKNYPKVVLKISSKQYPSLVSLANRVIASLTANLLYMTPVPSLANLQTATTDVENAIATWGPKGNRGSHADLLDLQNKSITLHITLRAIAEYVQNTAEIAAGNNYAEMASILGTSGLDQSIERSPQGVLDAVQALHSAKSSALQQNEVLVKWKKPLNVTFRGNVKYYKVYRGTTGVFSAAVEVASVTKTSFIDTNPSSAPVNWYYWVVPFNAAGAGITSASLGVNIMGA